MMTEVKSWGNSYAVRLTRRDLRRLGIQLGDQVDVQLRAMPKKKVDLSKMPIFYDTVSDVSERHDDYLYGEP